MYDKPAEVEFIPFPVSSGDSASGESRSSGEVSLDLGADVIKVEPLEGEARRQTGVIPGTSKIFQWVNRGKVANKNPIGKGLI